jgi:hypothetical protein
VMVSTCGPYDSDDSVTEVALHGVLNGVPIAPAIVQTRLGHDLCQL